MKRFEVILKLTTSLETPDNTKILSELHETIELHDGNDNCSDASLYDLDIYDNDGQGEIVVKLLVDSELEQDDFASSVFYKFDSHYVQKCSFEQVTETS